jgi:hypothetical protein
MCRLNLNLRRLNLDILLVPISDSLNSTSLSGDQFNGIHASCCTRSRDRTGMGKAHWFLRPARLPIPPSGQEGMSVGVGVGVCMHTVWSGCEVNRFGVVVQIIRMLGTAF